jgi:hypothetical protein
LGGISANVMPIKRKILNEERNPTNINLSAKPMI